MTAKHPELTPIDSSMFDGHHYDANTRDLTVRYKNGAMHVYHDVPAEKHAAFTGAQSPGRYFNERIKNQFTSRKLIG